MISAEYYSYCQSIRRQLHRCPELGNKEYETTKLIIKELKSFGYTVETPLEAGCVARLGDGECVAFRADIDALPVTEETGLEYASEVPGIMHACGHDIHTAVLLTVAKIVAQNRSEYSKSVKFIFQPDEEGNGGAKRLIEKGVMKDVACVYGMHIRPELSTGEIAVKYGKSYAASDMFTITVHGKSSHGAEPENGANAILAASEIIGEIKKFAPDGKDNETDSVASVCTFNSGTAGNIIPDKAVMSGILRSFGEKNRAVMRAKLKATLSVAEKFGCTAELDLIESYPGVVNHDEPTARVEAAAKKLFGKCTVLEKPTYTTEDFGYYLFEAPGTFFHVGVNSEYPLHNSKMNPDEESMKNATEIYLELLK